MAMNNKIGNNKDKITLINKTHYSSIRISI